MIAHDLSEDTKDPHSGVRATYRLSPTVEQLDAYEGDDEVTLRAIPLPMIIARRDFTAACVACAVGGALLATFIIAWVR